jgi:glucose/arabinose dehydrogenase
MDMEFAPGGRLFVAEQEGRVLKAMPDGTLEEFRDMSAEVAAGEEGGERGLQSLTFDPNFEQNQWLYLYYTRKTTDPTRVHNRIVRVTAKNGNFVAGSEKLIFQLNNQNSAYHMGGAMDFGEDGKLYISTGDNETPDNAQMLTNLFGKMLRINKDGTIPTGNPFYATASGKNRAIWA